MSNIIDQLKAFFEKKQPLPHGSFFYHSPEGTNPPYRLHLRLENDGTGILIINAKTVLHLNPTAAELAYYLTQKTPEEQMAAAMVKRYRASKEQIIQDYHELVERIQILIETPDLDPVTYMDFDRVDPYSKDLSAPYRLDLALTYHLDDENDPRISPRDRVKRELLTEEWIAILEKANAAGIPQIIFTGGEPTIRPDLPELIAATEKFGMVTGLLTDGLRLTDHDYLDSLLNNGLDHVMLLLDPKNEQSWEALRDIMIANVHCTVHLTLANDQVQDLYPVVDRLASMNVPDISISARSAGLKDSLRELQHYIASRHIPLVWDLPVPYSSFHPVALELAETETPPQGAGNAWLYVEPDGDVLPAQGIVKVLGNIHTDPWEQIWNNRKS
jgi:organic radical activating enzyme